MIAVYSVHMDLFHVHPYRKIRNVVKLKYDFATALIIQRGEKQKEVILNEEK